MTMRRTICALATGAILLSVGACGPDQEDQGMQVSGGCSVYGGGQESTTLGAARSLEALVGDGTFRWQGSFTVDESGATYEAGTIYEGHCVLSTAGDEGTHEALTVAVAPHDSPQYAQARDTMTTDTTIATLDGADGYVRPEQDGGVDMARAVVFHPQWMTVIVLRRPAKAVEDVPAALAPVAVELDKELTAVRR